MTKQFSTHLYAGRDLEVMSIAKNYSKWIVELLNPYIGKEVAEVGAGTGNLTQLLINKNEISRLTAFEPSINMYNYLTQCLSNNERVSLINSTFLRKLANT